MTELTAVALAGAIGAILSFVLATFPVVSDKWKNWQYKRETMAIVFLVSPFLVLAASCNNLYFSYFGCPDGAFVEPAFYIRNIVLGFSAFAGSQWGYNHGAEELQKSK